MILKELLQGLHLLLRSGRLRWIPATLRSHLLHWHLRSSLHPGRGATALLGSGCLHRCQLLLLHRRPILLLLLSGHLIAAAAHLTLILTIVVILHPHTHTQIDVEL
jgi:hypothetical protein